MIPDLSNIPIVYLHPGEIYFSSRDIVVSTILGSCVSIIMYNHAEHFAGISHCQLPVCKESKNFCIKCPEPFKYVDCTIHQMLKKFSDKGIHEEDIEIKIFGGADVLQKTGNRNSINTIGSQNVESVFKTISEHKLKIVASDVGGEMGRKILFRTQTGEVYLNRLKKNEKY